MKHLFLVLFVVLFISSSYAQTKYYIYFKDKGITTTSTLNKTSSLYKAAENQLSKRAIERRKKVMGEQSYITFEDLPLSQNYLEQIEALGIKIENKLKWFNAVTAYLTPEQIEKVASLSCVSKISQVRLFNSSRATENSKPKESEIKARQIQNTSSMNYGSSLNQNSISEIPPVHNLGINGEGVVVGVLDSGFNWKSSKVFSSLKVLGEYDFVNHDGITADETSTEKSIGQDYHGTAVLSIIGGYASGSLIGPAYKASYYLAKTEDISSEKHVEEDNYAAALEWLEAQGVDITTSSLGYTTFNSPETSYTYNDMNGQTTIAAQALNLAFDRGISTFSAVGNEGDKTDWYYGQDLGGNTFGKIDTPADAFNVISVGAVNAKKDVALFSSRGPTSDGRKKPEVCAMGVRDVSVVSGTNIYQSGDGTSYAAPIAAGIGALLKSVYPHITNQQIRKTFMECGDQAESPDNNKGYGVISAKSVICYPNLEQTSNGYTINKIFIDDSGVNSNSVQMYYRINNGNFVAASITYDGSLKYSAELPSSSDGSVIEFYYTYKESNETSVKVPSGDGEYFKFSYGSLNVSSLTDVENSIREIPAYYYLSQNYPNPFNPSTIIEYSVPSGKASMLINLKVYDILGREIATIVNEYQTVGNYKVQFDASSLNGKTLPSGIYFYRLTAGDFVQSKKMVLIK